MWGFEDHGRYSQQLGGQKKSTTVAAARAAGRARKATSAGRKSSKDATTPSTTGDPPAMAAVASNTAAAAAASNTAAAAAAATAPTTEEEASVGAALGSLSNDPSVANVPTAATTEAATAAETARLVAQVAAAAAAAPAPAPAFDRNQRSLYDVEAGIAASMRERDFAHQPLFDNPRARELYVRQQRRGFEGDQLPVFWQGVLGLSSDEQFNVSVQQISAKLATDRVLAASGVVISKEAAQHLLQGTLTDQGFHPFSLLARPAAERYAAVALGGAVPLSTGTRWYADDPDSLQKCTSAIGHYVRVVMCLMSCFQGGPEFVGARQEGCRDVNSHRAMTLIAQLQKLHATLQGAADRLGRGPHAARYGRQITLATTAALFREMQRLSGAAAAAVAAGSQIGGGHVGHLLCEDLSQAAINAEETLESTLSNSDIFGGHHHHQAAAMMQQQQQLSFAQQQQQPYGLPPPHLQQQQQQQQHHQQQQQQQQQHFGLPPLPPQFALPAQPQFGQYGQPQPFTNYGMPQPALPPYSSASQQPHLPHSSQASAAGTQQGQRRPGHGASGASGSTGAASHYGPNQKGERRQMIALNACYSYRQTGKCAAAAMQKFCVFGHIAPGAPLPVKPFVIGNAATQTLAKSG